jgi:hypothetical protein
MSASRQSVRKGRRNGHISLPALQSRRPGCSRLLHQQARLSKKSLRRQVGILHFGGGSVDRLRDAHPEKNEGSKSSAKVKNPSKINVVSPLGAGSPRNFNGLRLQIVLSAHFEPKWFFRQVTNKPAVSLANRAPACGALASDRETPLEVHEIPRPAAHVPRWRPGAFLGPSGGDHADAAPLRPGGLRGTSRYRPRDAAGHAPNIRRLDTISGEPSQGARPSQHRADQRILRTRGRRTPRCGRAGANQG